MSGEPKDPAIKLFGKTIPLPEAPPEGAADPDCNGFQETSSLPDEDISRDQDDAEIDQEKVEPNPTSSKQVDGAQSLSSLEDSANPDAASGIDKEAKASKSEEEQSETSNSQDKPLKKPDKILPCPRCNSMETKFCYYNNYNVNQPRHFCKNCQRYWTAGGTMRNVPVGAGRRKNKSSTSHYRHITVSEALQNARIDAPNGVVKPNGAVLAFGSDTPLCESMASALSLADKNMRNGYPKPDGLMVQVPTGDKGSTNEVVNGKNGPATVAYPPQVQYPGMPWPYLPIGPPPFCPPPGFAMPLYPAYYCGVPCAWPWVPGPVSPSQTSTSSNPNSPTLGKHSREETALKPSGSPEDESLKEGNSEKSLWVPKTLRIDDPEDAAKSSIWATLGIKKDSPDLASRAGLFRGFRTKGDLENCVADASHMLQANPAAMSRSRNFNENS